jgi:hypothetical protein
VRLPRRRTETCSRSIALPDEESRGPLQDLPLLTQHPVFALQLTQPSTFLRTEQIVTLARIRLVLAQQVTQRLLRTVELTASCFGVRNPLRNILIASRRNSGRYGGLVFGTIRSSPEPLARKHRGVNRSGSTPTPRAGHPRLALCFVLDLGRVLGERFRASDAVAVDAYR